jgi:hypothetical protein
MRAEIKDYVAALEPQSHDVVLSNPSGVAVPQYSGPVIFNSGNGVFFAKLTINSGEVAGYYKVTWTMWKDGESNVEETGFQVRLKAI